MAEAKQPDPKSVRRRIRAPYRVEAQVEITGSAAPVAPIPVETRDASEWGIGIHSSQPLPRVAVRLHVTAPDRSRLSIDGWVIYSQQISVDVWGSGIEFDSPQPMFSAARIDHADYGR